MKDAHLSREQLYAYQDGLLPVTERSAVERHLETCAECRAQFAQSAALVDVLKRQLRSTHAPPSLRSAISQQLGAREQPASKTFLPARGRALASAAIIALLLLAVTFAIAFWVNGTPTLITQLVETHNQLVENVLLAQRQGNAEELATWLGDQVGAPIQVPTPDGFSLVGARVEKVDGDSVAHILYQQTNGDALSLFVWRGISSTDDLTLRQVNGGQFYVGTATGRTVVIWSERDLNYACVGDASPDAMLTLAAHVWSADKN